MFNLLEKFWPTNVDGTDDEPDDGPAIDWSRVQLSSSEFQRRTQRMERDAIPEDEPVSNVIAVRFAPALVSWTRTEPATGGLYFCKHTNGPTRVVDVYQRGSRMYAEWSDIPEFAVAGSGMWWGDHPIQEPT